ncbi:non-ribosomal peptide synthetase, partial [Pleionea sp. CnH1-48]|uniref:non-ribosomal peptide synthetase n=1 Tax=Pleionea sp. CnH1-48 TaxID=2954494 RepID=UPI0020968357
MSIEHIIDSLTEKNILITEVSGELKVKAPKGVMTAELAALIKSNKTAILEYLTNTMNQLSSASISPIVAVDRSSQADFPLSSAQRRLWFVDKLGGGSSEYNLPAAVKVRGDFDTQVAKIAIEHIIQRHEVLRSLFVETEEGPRQTIRESIDFSISYDNLSQLEGHKKQAKVNEIIEQEGRHVFSLSQDLLLRVKYLQLSEGSEKEGVLVFNIHHIVSDGWSTGVLISEFVHCYDAIVRKQQPQLSELPAQYIDYAAWQEQQIQNGEHQSQTEFWQKQLEEMPLIHSLPLDYERPLSRQFEGECVKLPLSKSLSEKVQSLAKHYQVTPFVLMHAVFALVLARHGNNHDVVIGTSVANRTRAELDGLIGFFVNTLVLRTNTDYELVEDFIKHVSLVNLDAQANQSIPFEQVVDACNIPRSTQYAPAFQILMSMDTNAASELSIPGLTFEPIGNQREVARYDLHFNVQSDEQHIILSWIYDKALFKQESIEAISRHTQTLLESLVDQPAAKISDLALLSSEEEAFLIDELNQTAVEFNGENSVPKHIENIVQQYQNQTAVVDEEGTLSYAELWEKSNRLAALLEESGVEEGARVGILLHPTSKLLISMLGILKNRCSYIPLLLEQGTERLDAILKDADIEMVLVENQTLDLLSMSNVDVLMLDESVYEGNWLNEYSGEIFKDAIEPEDTAYIIYTSGSTGKPKGVEISHSGLLDYCQYALNDYYTQLDGSLVVTLPAFDITVPSLYLPLMTGGVVNFLQYDAILPELASKLVGEQQKSWLLRMTPMHTKALVELVEEPVMQLHAFVIGGDAFHADTAKALQAKFPNSQIYNHYGPTETVVGASIYDVTKNLEELTDTIPIGKPMPNTRFYVLNGQRQLVPFGAPGELFIGGNGVAKGYLNLDDVNKESFINNPFSEKEEKIYRTGDRVRYFPDGNLEFLGRTGSQVKVNGYRIECGEIEAQLSRHESVESCLVSTIKRGEQTQLVGYFIAAKQSVEASLVEELKDYLGSKVPDYMVPAVLMEIKGWPLNRNGKVDKKALPVPDSSSKQWEDAQTHTEKVLQKIWAQLLKTPQHEISVNADFFELGGDSILSIQLASRAAKENIFFSITDLFNAKTIRALAKRSEENAEKKSYSKASGSLTLLPMQAAFLENTMDLHHYNQSVLLTTPDYFDIELLKPIMTKVCEEHDILRLSFEHQSDGWHAEFRDDISRVISSSIECVNSDSLNAEAFEDIAGSFQQSLDLTQGRLFKAVLFKSKNESEDGRLLLIFHHMVIDGVSWRILLQDFETLLEQSVNQSPLQLPPRSASVQQWSQHLSDWARREELEQEKNYWLNSYQSHARRFCDIAGKGEQKPLLLAKSSILDFSLEASATQKLLGQCQKTYRTQINELLLAALSLAFYRWSGEESLRLYMEGHGRTCPDNSIDLTRTIGWLTSVFPVSLNVKENDIANAICDIKEQYRQMPNSGLSFGVFKHMVNDADINALPDPELVFNYLGQLDRVLEDEGVLQPAYESCGNSVSLRRHSAYSLILNAQVENQRMQFRLMFDKEHYQEDKLADFLSALETSLLEIIEHCCSVNFGSYTPSDFPLAQASREDLELWSIDSKVSDLYPATEMQQGLLFHSMLAAGSYTVQTLFNIKHLDVENFKSAWGNVIEQHAIFRTGFVGLEQGNAHQKVYLSASMPWQIFDISTLPESEQQAHIHDYRQADGDKAFRLDEAPLMRMTLFKISDNEHALLWSRHHALLDAWCTTKVVDDVFKAYASQEKGEEPAATYREYVEWLQQRNWNEADEYWKKQLSTLNGMTSLPFYAQNPRQDNVGKLELDMTLNEQQTQQVLEFVRSQRVTTNVLVQAAWALLLARYSNESTVAFGATTSGRPADLRGVEDIVGIFINTVPVVIDVESHDSVGHWLRQLHQQLIEREEFGLLPLLNIQKLSHFGNTLFDSLLVFENTPLDQEVEERLSGGALDVEVIDSYHDSNYGIELTALMAKQLSINFAVKSRVMTPTQLDAMVKEFKTTLLTLIESTEQPVNEIELLSEQDIQHLTRDLNPVVAKDKVYESALSQFEQQVQTTPEAIALSMEGES